MGTGNNSQDNKDFIDKVALFDKWIVSLDVANHSIKAAFNITSTYGIYYIVHMYPTTEGHQRKLTNLRTCAADVITLCNIHLLIIY